MPMRVLSTSEIGSEAASTAGAAEDHGRKPAVENPRSKTRGRKPAVENPRISFSY